MWLFWSSVQVWMCLVGAVAFGVVGKKVNRARLSTKPRDLDFATVMKNVSVVLGQDAEFTCKLRLNNKNLQFQLVWIKLDTQTILAIGNQLVQHNPRISVSDQDRSEFTLRIKSTQPDDGGVYACRINTKPFSQMRATLNVKVSPSIVPSLTSENFNTKENADAVLKCRATGNPTPTILWTREDGGLIRTKGRDRTTQYKGPLLTIPKLTRKDMGTYHCLATNGVSPSVSQRITVTAEFLPTVEMEPPHVSAWIGGSAEIKCDVEAHPEPVFIWSREGNVLSHGAKYSTRTELVGGSTYRTKMTLTIKSVTEQDFGEYICSASSFLGSGSATGKLYEITPPKRTNVPRGQSETDAGTGERLTSGVRCHWIFQNDGRACSPVYAILLLLPDNSAIYDSQQADDAWSPERALGSKRRDSKSAGSVLHKHTLLFSSCLLYCLLWKTFMERT